MSAVIATKQNGNSTIAAFTTSITRAISVRTGFRGGVIAAGLRGPTGQIGPIGPAGGAAVERTAGETLSALKVVWEVDNDVFLLDPTDQGFDQIDFVLGITLTSATTGDPLNVQRSGTLDDNSWSWTPGLVFAGPDGGLTQTPPVDGWELVIGFASSPTRLEIDIDEPVLLAQEQ